jgi:cytochrome oxidase assembly protein ShyY1
MAALFSNCETWLRMTLDEASNAYEEGVPFLLYSADLWPGVNRGYAEMAERRYSTEGHGAIGSSHGVTVLMRLNERRGSANRESGEN